MRAFSVISFRYLLLALLFLGGAASLAAQGLTARAGIESNSVFVGEPIRFQIQVSGSETPEAPDFAKIPGLVVKPTGSGSNSRRSVRIINGKRTENVQLGYIFNYELRATREGRIAIPAITVKADGKVAQTQPVILNAQKPSETENYKLRVNMSKTSAYVGEQIVLEAIFYFRGEVADLNLSLPIVDNGAMSARRPTRSRRRQ